MRVLIQLVGSQPLPNLLPPLYLKPDKIIFVSTQQTEEVRRRLESVVGSCQTILCDAYDIENLTEQLRSELRACAEGNFIFNLTGGTKAMVLAANQVALATRATVVYLESERGRNVLYEYRYDEQKLKLTAKSVLPDLIGIEQFLDVHIGKGQWQERGPSKDEGGRFEQAVANALQTHLTQAEIRQGIKFLGREGSKRPQIDLDIVVRCGNQFARIECKDSSKSTLDAVKQLNLVTELLGTYTYKFIAMSNQPNPDHTAVYEATRTRVISLNSFNGTELSAEDQEKLASAISESICHPAP